MRMSTGHLCVEKVDEPTAGNYFDRKLQQNKNSLHAKKKAPMYLYLFLSGEVLTTPNTSTRLAWPEGLHCIRRKYFSSFFLHLASIQNKLILQICQAYMRDKMLIFILFLFIMCFLFNTCFLLNTLLCIKRPY